MSPELPRGISIASTALQDAMINTQAARAALFDPDPGEDPTAFLPPALAAELEQGLPEVSDRIQSLLVQLIEVTGEGA